jgi:hypothetical protein
MRARPSRKSPAARPRASRTVTRTRRGRRSAAMPSMAWTRIVSLAPRPRSSISSTKPDSGAITIRSRIGASTARSRSTPAAKPAKIAASPMQAAKPQTRCRRARAPPMESANPTRGAHRAGRPSAAKNRSTPTANATAIHGKSRRRSISSRSHPEVSEPRAGTRTGDTQADIPPGTNPARAPVAVPRERREDAGRVCGIGCRELRARRSL